MNPHKEKMKTEKKKKKEEKLRNILINYGNP
jgi:hypothetical protein